MASINKVILMGRLTRDPELRTTGSGVSICKFTIAVSRKFKSNSGELREETAFIDVDCFGKTAEIIAKYFTKAKPIYVEGRLKLDQWESKGEKRSKLSVVLETFQFVDNSSHEQSNSYSEESNYKQNNASDRNDGFSHSMAGISDSSHGLDEDVPF